MPDKPVRILWASRHPVMEAQANQLKLIFGEGVEIVWYARRFVDGNEILNHFVSNKFDELVIVAPEAILKFLLSKGIKPIKSVGSGHIKSNGTAYHFSHFERLLEYELKFHFLRKPLRLGGHLYLLTNNDIGPSYRRKVAQMIGDVVITFEPDSPAVDFKKKLAKASNRYKVVITRSASYQLAELKEKLSPDVILLVEDSIPATKQIDFVNPQGQARELRGFLVVDKAIYKTEILHPLTI